MKKINPKNQGRIFMALCVAALLMIVTLCALFLESCAPKPTYTPKDRTHGPIMFGFENVLGYCIEDSMLTIKYDDGDAWDYDNLAYMSGREEWYGEFILLNMCHADESAFMQDYLTYLNFSQDYNANWEKIDSLNMHWGIYETFIEGDFVFEVVRMNHEDWQKVGITW